MKSSLLRFIVPVLIILLLDLYSFQAVRTVTSGLSEPVRRIIYVAFWLVTAIALGTLITAQFIEFSSWPKPVRIYLTSFIIIIYLSKIVVIPFLLIDDLWRGIKWGVSRIQPSNNPLAPEHPQITRSEFLSQTALLVAGVPFFAMLYGMAYGGYDYKVRKRKIKFDKLPKAFDGFRIVQISDIHSGSFMNTNYFEEVVEKINSLKPDVIFFTGDLVNDSAEEVYPFKEVFSKLSAPMGVYSILGNHDYGDYKDWGSKEAKQQNLTDLKDIQKQMGWKLLLNENVILERSGHNIAIAGVENWSASNRFPKYGNLSKSLKGLENIPFTILLSHDPSHWKGQILETNPKVDLTLSGHTHGMQFGVETKWFRWSPSQYFYEQWAGLYKRNDQYLYVNRGIGFIGYPGRAGIRPEITVLELEAD